MSTKDADQSSVIPPTKDASRGDTARRPNISSRLLAAYKQMLVALFLATLFVCGALIVILLWFFVTSGNPPLIFIVVLGGCLGSFFSSLTRLYRFEDLPKALIMDDLLNLPKIHLLLYSLVPALVGAIAATILYLIFAGGLLQGDLFPSFRCDLGEAKCDLFKTLLDNWHPAQAKDYAKILVWAFIAGFAERLVPNTLESLGRSAQSQAGNEKQAEQGS